MQPYNRTITWLRFRIELAEAPSSFWLLLGACTAELQRLGNIPLPAVEARRLERNLLATGVHACLVMDGINLPVDRIEQRLKGKTRLPIGQENVLLELDALLHTGQLIASGTYGNGPLTTEKTKRFHNDLLQGSTEEEFAGRWRNQLISNKPGDGVPPEVIELFMDELCDWLDGPELRPPSRTELPAYALIRILLAELYLHWIRPFEGGQARVSGMVAQYLLSQAGMGSIAGHLLAIHFHRHGRELQRMVQQASEGTADPLPFITYALRGLAEGLNDLNERIRLLQTSGQWRAQLLDLFSDANDGPTRRQRRLLLDLGEHHEPVPLARLPKLSTALADLYAGVSDKTLRRDVDALVAAGVLRRSPDGLRVERGNILAFSH